MAFERCELVFSCDSCGAEMSVFPDMQIENIDKLVEWVEWAFEQDELNHHPPIGKIDGKHYCHNCLADRLES